MAYQEINRGQAPNDGNGESAWSFSGKINSMFSELYTLLASLINGTKVLSDNNFSNTLKTNYDAAHVHSQATGNPHTTTKSDVGLGNVDNTSDLNKPVSTATQTAINNAVVGLYDDRGNYDASGNTFPASGGSGTEGAILKGDVWMISVAGTVGGTAVVQGDSVRALIDSPGQTAGNWAVSTHGTTLTYASQAEAETGTENTKVMTALRVFQAIAAWVLGDLSGLIVNTAISAGDTIKQAFGKLQGQMNVGDDLTLTTGTNAIDLTNNITGKQYALYDMASGALTLTAAANPKTFGCASGVIRADGSTVPNVSAFTVFSGTYTNTNDVDNHWFVIRRNGGNYLYWSQSEN